MTVTDALMTNYMVVSNQPSAVCHDGLMPTRRQGFSNHHIYDVGISWFKMPWCLTKRQAISNHDIDALTCDCRRCSGAKCSSGRQHVQLADSVTCIISCTMHGRKSYNLSYF